MHADIHGAGVLQCYQTLYSVSYDKILFWKSKNGFKSQKFKRDYYFMCFMIFFLVVYYVCSFHLVVCSL